MKVHNRIQDFPSNIRTIVTIGTFDGVHKGHKIILEKMNKIASQKDLHSVMLTFSPHPRQVLYPEHQNIRLLNTLEEKKYLLENTSLDHIVVQNFTKDFSRTKSVNFIRDFLVNKLNMKHMVVGYNHQFGKNREGDYSNLLQLSDLYSFEIEKIDAQLIDGIKVSSTKIRNFLIQGDISTANNLLGYSYGFSGKVIHGDKIARKINFPTANLEVCNEKLIPNCGVYAVKIYISQKEYLGMCNIGCANSKIEVHIFDFSKNIYGNTIKIKFIERLRNEMKLNTLEKLKKQLEKDQLFTKRIFRL